MKSSRSLELIKGQAPKTGIGLMFIVNYVASHISEFPGHQFRELWVHNKVQCQFSDRSENCRLTMFLQNANGHKMKLLLAQDTLVKGGQGGCPPGLGIEYVAPGTLVRLG